MSEQDLIAKARGVVDAFSAGDLERSAAQHEGVYNELGTQRIMHGKDEIKQGARGLEEGDAGCEGNHHERLGQR